MKRLILILSTTFCLSDPGFAQLKYKLPDATLTANQICGKDICDPGDVGKLLHYTKSPISPAVSKATTAEDVAVQILGQTVSSARIRLSKDFTTCSQLSNNPFTKSDVENVKFPDGRSISYNRTEKLELNIKAAVEANVKELMKQTADLAKIEKLKGKVQAAYQKINGKVLTVEGKYSEWQLSKEARDKLKKGDGFQECRKWIQENDQRIFLAAGIVYFQITYDENSLDQLAADLDAEFAKEGLTASISFAFKREVAKRLKATSEVYQVLIVRHAGINGKEFVE